MNATKTPRRASWLTLLALLLASVGCCVHRPKVLRHPDYGTIDAVPHCVTGSLIKDPLYYGHRATRWRELPPNQLCWDPSAWSSERPTEADVMVEEGEPIEAVQPTDSPEPTEPAELPLLDEAPDAAPPADEPPSTDVGHIATPPSPQPEIDRLPELPAAPAPEYADATDPPMPSRLPTPIPTLEPPARPPARFAGGLQMRLLESYTTSGAEEEVADERPQPFEVHQATHIQPQHPEKETPAPVTDSLPTVTIPSASTTDYVEPPDPPIIMYIQPE